MVNEGYNTHLVIRGTLGMSASYPTDTLITNWVNLIDGMIERVKSSPDTATAAHIEMNRLGAIFTQIRINKDKPEGVPVIAELSDSELDDLFGAGRRTVWIK